MNADAAVELELDGRTVRLSNLDRVLWPVAGVTKGAVIDYYRRVAPVLVPHLAGRVLTLGRFPEGITGRAWYQTNCRGNPSWLATHIVVGRGGAAFRMCVVNDLPSLVWVVNQGAFELHPFLSRVDRPADPTAVVFDLDPGEPAGLVESCVVALRLRAALDAIGLSSLVKTSGSVGLHVFVPLNTPAAFEDTKTFARDLAARLAAEHRDEVVDVQRKSARVGRVLIDWLQNDPTRSTVAPYSVRASAWPAVSTPVTWDEVERMASERDPGLMTFGPRDVLDRVDRLGDLFRPVLEARQVLPV